MTVEQIVVQLEDWSKKYYSGNEEVDDATFDALEDKLRTLDPSNAYFKKNREVPGYGTKANHIYEFVGSLDKIHAISESKVLPLYKRVIASAKLDGASLVTYFKDGKLDKAVTRGDGKQGIDVTAHYLAITNKYGVTIPENFTGAIRGEVLFSNDNWKRFKAIHPEAKYPRNSGTGLLNQKTVLPVEERLLDYVVYDVLATSIPVADYWYLLERFNYPTASRFLASNPTDEEIKAMYDEWSKIYPIDGIVLRAYGDELAPLAGNPTLYTYWPKKQEAYKFQAEVKEVTIKDITWQLGRTGKLTPVLNIEPTEMTGAIVSNITAHNAAMVKEMQLGKGAKVLAYRSGDVIPTLKETTVPAAVVQLPTVCPYCGQSLEFTSTGKDLVCTNSDCAGMKKFRVSNFIEVICKDIKGLGDAFLENFISEVAPDFSIPRLIFNCHKGIHFPLKSLGNADNAIAAKVVHRIATEQFTAHDFWLSLGIRLLGEEAAKKFQISEKDVKYFIIQVLQDRPYEAQKTLLTIFPGQIALVTNIMNSLPLIGLTLVHYISSGRDFIYTTATTAHYYAITGSLSKPRKQLQEEFAARGWQMTETLSKAELLINNDATSNSSKNQKAKQLNIPILTEEEFRDKYLPQQD